jgi:hypothetical protein
LSSRRRRIGTGPIASTWLVIFLTVPHSLLSDPIMHQASADSDVAIRDSHSAGDGRVSARDELDTIRAHEKIK